jgi:ribonucleoside-diphosphate reductase alpha chain
MGLGDTLIKLHIRHGSEESLKFIEKVYKLIAHEAYITSSDLAKEKGSFKKFEASKFIKSGFMKTLPAEIRKKVKMTASETQCFSCNLRARRHLWWYDIGDRAGLNSVTRRDRLGEHAIRHYLYDEWYAVHENDMKSGKIKRPAYFCSANDLSPEDHVMVQAVIQRYVDASISKTVNAPATHTIEDVKKLYTMAYDQGLKGIAYMREGSRQGVLERKKDPAEKRSRRQLSLNCHKATLWLSTDQHTN